MELTEVAQSKLDPLLPQKSADQSPLQLLNGDDVQSTAHSSRELLTSVVASGGAALFINRTVRGAFVMSGLVIKL